MKKLAAFLMVFAAVLSPYPRVVRADAVDTDIRVTFNGSFIESEQPFYVDDETERLLLPLRPILESFGVEAEGIYYDEDEGLVYCESYAFDEDVDISIYIGSYTAYVNGVQVDVDTPARLVDEYVYIPLRFLCDAFNAELTWDGVDGIAAINIQ